MILIDALYINNSGGKILLDYLIENLEKTDFEIYYLLDKRIENNHSPIKSSNSVFYLKANLLNRHRFYKKNINSFTKVFCFGNLPPSTKLHAEVYTYFHQRLFLSVPKNINFKQKGLLYIKTIIFRYLHKYTDKWLVQSSSIKDELLEFNKNIKTGNILITPFYPEFKINELSMATRNRYGFVYVSSGERYKNHIRLLHAFKKVYQEHKLGELHLTISNEFQELILIINDLVEKGYPIINHGFINRVDLEKIYEENTFCIYPSLTESFGLGIIEAIDKGCKIIGADLPYTFSVCKPSLIFNPFLEESIYAALEKAIIKDSPSTVKKTSNKINELIELLKK